MQRWKWDPKSSIFIYIGCIDSSIPLLMENVLTLMGKYTWWSAIYAKNHYRWFVINSISIRRFVFGSFGWNRVEISRIANLRKVNHEILSFKILINHVQQGVLIPSVSRVWTSRNLNVVQEKIPKTQNREVITYPIINFKT